MNDTIYQEIAMLVYTNLELNCPVLSGNMKSHIEYDDVESNFTRISISGPSYDFNEWKKTGKINHTNQYDYAISVNELGAFMGKSKKSKHWANKAIVNACKAVAQVYNAEVIVDVEL